MPYINPGMRNDLSKNWAVASTVGELNYLLTLKALEFLKQRGLSYATINTVIASFERTKTGDRLKCKKDTLTRAMQDIIEDFRDNNTGEVSSIEIGGAIECAKLEFYRRVAAPYEDKKIAENGDVYPAII